MCLGVSAAGESPEGDGPGGAILNRSALSVRSTVSVSPIKNENKEESGLDGSWNTRAWVKRKEGEGPKTQGSLKKYQSSKRFEIQTR